MTAADPVLQGRSVNLISWYWDVPKEIFQARILDAPVHLVVTEAVMPAVVQQPEVAEAAQHAQQGAESPQHGSNSQAQHAQQEPSTHGDHMVSPGGVLRKPKPVGIGHMCRAISTLTGGELSQLRLCMIASRSNYAAVQHAVQTYIHHNHFLCGTRLS